MMIPKEQLPLEHSPGAPLISIFVRIPDSRDHALSFWDMLDQANGAIAELPGRQVSFLQAFVECLGFNTWPFTLFRRPDEATTVLRPTPKFIAAICNASSDDAIDWGTTLAKHPVWARTAVNPFDLAGQCVEFHAIAKASQAGSPFLWLWDDPGADPPDGDT